MEFQTALKLKPGFEKARENLETVYKKKAGDKE